MGSLLEARAAANAVMLMPTRPRGMTIRDVVTFADQFRIQKPDRPQLCFDPKATFKVSL